MQKRLLILTGCCAVAIAFFLLFVRPATPQSSEGAKVTWASPSYQIILFPGTVKAADLTFTSSGLIPDASIFITPSLSQLLSIAPPGNGTIPAGQTATVHATVSAPLRTATGTYEGTLHIRSGASTVAQPLPVVIQIVAPSATIVPTEGSVPSPDRIATTPGGVPYVKDEIDVILKEGTASPDQRIEQIAATTDGVIIGFIPALATYQLRYNVSDFQALDAIRTTIEQMQGVENALFAGGTAQPAMTPNDPCAWGSGLSPCTSFLKFVQPINRWGFEFVSAPAAWDTQNGSGSVVVGVIDVDFDATHEDLKDNIQASVFTSQTTQLCNAQGCMPTNGHGTFVSGTVAAVGNNGIGVAGMAWRTSLRLYDYGNVPGGVPALMEEAANDGAKIVNISSGYGEDFKFVNGSIMCPPNPPDVMTQKVVQSETIQYRNAILWAQNHQKDVLWVFAAGNGCQDAQYLTPANLAGVFPDGTLTKGAIITAASVGSGAATQNSLGPGNILSTFSNRGDLVTVAAPGERIYSTMPGICFFGICNYSLAYGFGDGTSFAAPFVSGLAAIVLSQHPTFTAAQIKQCIVNAAQSAGPPVSGQIFHSITAPEAVTCSSFSPAPTQFTMTGNMTQPRFQHTATLLPNGKVLIAGGGNGAKSLAIAELYDPLSKTFTLTGSMNQARQLHTAVLLADGRVLVVGGCATTPPFSICGDLASAEVYDPLTGTWSVTGSLATARVRHAMVRLNNGNVLVVGGANDSNGNLSSAEVYDITTGVFVPAGTMTSGRYAPTATLLSNGTVLIAGGGLASPSLYSSDYALATAEIYDPIKGTFTATDAMRFPRFEHTATLLPNGKVLIAGGGGTQGAFLDPTSELYDPTMGTFTTAGNMVMARRSHTAVTLPNGEVFVVGGSNFTEVISSMLIGTTEFFNLNGNSFAAGPNLNTPRVWHTETPLPNGNVLVTGGLGGIIFSPLATAELAQ